MDQIVADVRQRLRDLGQETVRESSRRFFKEDILVHGVKSADVKKVAAAAFRRMRALTREDVYGGCEALWQSGYLEEGGVACEWSYALRQQYLPEDFDLFAAWLERYVGNWASCDTLCNHTLGALLERYPDRVEALSGWTASANRWKSRGAAVSLIVPARKGLFLEHVLVIADRLLADPDDLVQKGYGWLLKAASQAHPDAVFRYLMDHRAVMPRTAFRYALEKFPLDRKAQAMRRP